jgi:23S rRNA A2030 N6-methylase RlmJ
MGETRLLNPDDMAALALVAQMRQALSTTDAITAALAAGERLEVEEEQQEFYPPAPVLAAELARREGQLEELREERDHLREELRGERTARLEALERAARAEAKLEARGEHRSPQRPRERQNRPWWKLWN